MLLRGTFITLARYRIDVLVTHETEVGEAKRYRREVGYDYSARVAINRGMLK
jgi:hypothetical protein